MSSNGWSFSIGMTGLFGGNTQQRNLLYSGTKSCGCLAKELSSARIIERTEVYVGKQINFFTIISQNLERKDRKGNRYWNCLCICGNIRVNTSGTLLAGKTVSCGCYGAKQSLIKNRKHGMEGTPEYKLLSSARERTKEKGLPDVDFPLEDIKIPELCPVLGIPIFIKQGRRNHSPTLDRIIPELGYVRGNVAIISYKANRIKSDNSADDLRKIIAYMKSFLCDCGKNMGVSKGVCGCYKDETPREVRKPFERHGQSRTQEYRTLYNCRDRALKEKIPFNLTLEDIKFSEFCPIFKDPLHHSKIRRTENSPSIDRVFPELGYVRGNIAFISQRANRKKYNSSIEELEAILKYIENHQ